MSKTPDLPLWFNGRIEWKLFSMQTRKNWKVSTVYSTQTALSGAHQALASCLSAPESVPLKPNRQYSGALLRHWKWEGRGTKGQDTFGWLTKVQRLKSDSYSSSSIQSSKDTIFSDTWHIVSHWLGMRITTTLWRSSVIVLSKKDQSRQERMATTKTLLASAAWLNDLKQWLKFRRKAYLTFAFFLNLV